MNDGLKDCHRTAIVRVITGTEGIDKAVLLGSRATQSFAAIADVDIALFGPDPTLINLARMAAAVDAIPMAQSVVSCSTTAYSVWNSMTTVTVTASSGSAALSGPYWPATALALSVARLSTSSSRAESVAHPGR